MVSVSHGGTSDGYLYSSPIKEPFSTTRPGEERRGEEDGGRGVGSREYKGSQKRKRKKYDVAIVLSRTVRLVGNKAKKLSGGGKACSGDAVSKAEVEKLTREKVNTMNGQQSNEA